MNKLHIRKYGENHINLLKNPPSQGKHGVPAKLENTEMVCFDVSHNTTLIYL